MFSNSLVVMPLFLILVCSYMLIRKKNVKFVFNAGMQCRVVQSGGLYSV